MGSHTQKVMQVVVPEASGGNTQQLAAMNKSNNNWMGNLYEERSLQEVADCRNFIERSVYSVVKVFG